MGYCGWFRVDVREACCKCTFLSTFTWLLCILHKQKCMANFCYESFLLCPSILILWFGLAVYCSESYTLSLLAPDEAQYLTSLPVPHCWPDRSILFFLIDSPLLYKQMKTSVFNHCFNISINCTHSLNWFDWTRLLKFFCCLGGWTGNGVHNIIFTLDNKISQFQYKWIDCILMVHNVLRTFQML